jgi:hypothetical protein
LWLEGAFFGTLASKPDGDPIGCATLDLRSIKTNAGIAGKDIRAIHEVWPETAIRLSHRNWAFVTKK